MGFPLVICNNNEFNIKEYENNKHADFWFNFNKFKVFTVRTIDEIPVGGKYTVYLSVYSDFYNEDYSPRYSWIDGANGSVTGYHFTMPERIWNDSHAGLVTWIVEWNTESNLWDRIDFRGMLNALNISHIPERLWFLTAAETDNGYNPRIKDYLENTIGIRVYHSNGLDKFCTAASLGEDYYRHVGQKLESISKRTITPYKAVCYNRRPREHRVLMLSHMRNRGYIDRVIHSLGLGNFGVSNISKEHFPYMIDDMEFYTNRSHDIKPQEDETNIDLEVNQAHAVCFPHGLKSQLHIVSESVTTEHTFITEKSYKPFLMMQPFIQYGNVDNVKAIKMRGFDTFDKWIDHSYDTENDDMLRLKYFFKELDRLMAFSDVQWAEMMYDMADTLCYNAELVERVQPHFPIKYFIKELMDFYNS